MLPLWGKKKGGGGVVLAMLKGGTKCKGVVLTQGGAKCVHPVQRRAEKMLS